MLLYVFLKHDNVDDKLKEPYTIVNEEKVALMASICVSNPSE